MLGDCIDEPQPVAMGASDKQPWTTKAAVAPRRLGLTVRLRQIEVE